MAEGMSVPSRRLVSSAMANLERLGMLTQEHSDTEHLTALGRRVMYFSTPPHFSKALVLASVFRCVVLSGEAGEVCGVVVMCREWGMGAEKVW